MTPESALALSLVAVLAALGVAYGYKVWRDRRNNRLIRAVRRGWVRPVRPTNKGEKR